MATETSVAAVVLAAGFSLRLGRPKQTIVLEGETLLERVARVARLAELSPVLVIVNAQLADDPSFPQQRLVDLGCTVVVNREAVEGMASSVRCGIEALQSHNVAGTVLMTCDQVAVTPPHLRTLAAKPEEVCASGYAGKVGVPAYFPRGMFESLMNLRGDQGARDLLPGVRVVMSEDLAIDVDSEEELQRARKWAALLELERT